MLISAYKRLLSKRPLLTQMIVAGSLCSSGDVISQAVIEHRHLNDYEISRTIRFFALGSLYIAPILRRWYLVLERVQGNPKIAPLKRVILDQILAAPVILSGFLICLRLLEGNEMEKSIRRWKSDLFPILFTGWKIWPAVQLLNFYLVPLNHRILFVQTVALFWNTYLAFITRIQ